MFVVAFYLVAIHVALKYGATAGKLMCRCEIRMNDGRPLTLTAAILRTLGQTVIPGIITYPFGFLLLFIFGPTAMELTGISFELLLGIAQALAQCAWLLLTFLLVSFTKSKRSLSDRFAGTKVIYK